MGSPALSVFEHANIPVAPSAGLAELSESEADHLCWLGEQLPGFCSRGYRSIKLSQHCGLVNLGARVLEILPKAGETDSSAQSRGVFLRLLRACPDFPLQRQAAAGHGQRSAPLLDIFIRVFFDEVTALMKGGLLRRYREQEEDCLAVRGSILLNRQFTVLANRTDFIACRYDELTADNRWNRIIKAALRAVRPWMHGIDLQRSWIELMAGFDEVTDSTEARSLLSGLRYDRQGNRYRPAIEWVERILSLLSPDFRPGEESAPGLLFDMNRLFETVVTSRMQSWAWERGWNAEPQNSTRFLAQIVSEPRKSAFRLRPDLLFTKQGRPVAIADAKWKRPDLSGSGFVMPDQSDLYQLHAYVSAFRCEHFALIYPWEERMHSTRETTFQLPLVGSIRPRVTVLFLDVAEDDLPLRLATDAWIKNVVSAP